MVSQNFQGSGLDDPDASGESFTKDHVCGRSASCNWFSVGKNVQGPFQSALTDAVGVSFLV